jgi:hypothetical protein
MADACAGSVQCHQSHAARLRRAWTCIRGNVASAAGDQEEAQHDGDCAEVPRCLRLIEEGPGKHGAREGLHADERRHMCGG